MTRRFPSAAAALMIAAMPLAVTPVAALPSVAWAQPTAGEAHQAPLAKVLKMLAAEHKGKQLNTTMGQSGGRAVYLIQWQLPNGRITVFTVDAQTGQVVGQ